MNISLVCRAMLFKALISNSIWTSFPYCYVSCLVSYSLLHIVHQECCQIEILMFSKLRTQKCPVKMSLFLLNYCFSVNLYVWFKAVRSVLIIFYYYDFIFPTFLFFFLSPIIWLYRLCQAFLSYILYVPYLQYFILLCVTQIVFS